MQKHNLARAEWQQDTSHSHKQYADPNTEVGSNNPLDSI